MTRIFISYRRGDTATVVGRLYDQLASEFGKTNVFRDLYSISPGSDFESAIEHTLKSCDVCLAVIGLHWDKHAVAAGGDPRDFVHAEIESALKYGLRVIPVLVDGAALPAENTLSETLRPMIRRQALELSDSRWEYDVSRLLDSLTLPVDEGAGGAAADASQPRWKKWIGRASIVPALLAANLWAAIGLGLKLTFPLTSWTALAARAADPLVAMVILATALLAFLFVRRTGYARPGRKRTWSRLERWSERRSARGLLIGTFLALLLGMWMVPRGVVIEERSGAVAGDFCGRYFVDSRMQSDLTQQCPGDRNVGKCGAVAFSCEYYEVRIFTGVLPISRLEASVAIAGVQSDGTIESEASVTWADAAVEKVNDAQRAFSWGIGGRDLKLATPRGAIPRTFRMLATRQHDPNTPPVRVDIVVTVSIDASPASFRTIESFVVRSE